jgi:hypothetical protein
MGKGKGLKSSQEIYVDSGFLGYAGTPNENDISIFLKPVRSFCPSFNSEFYRALGLGSQIFEVEAEENLTNLTAGIWQRGSFR